MPKLKTSNCKLVTISLRLLITIAITSSTITSVLAQEVDEISKMESLPSPVEGDILCKVICTFTPKKDEIYYVKIGSKYYGAPLVGEGVSQEIPVRKTRQFILHKKTQNEEGEDIYTPALNATLTGSGSKYMVILSQKKNQPITSIVHSLSKTKLPANKVHLFNLSPVPLGIQVGDNKYVAKKRELISHNFKQAGRNSYASAKVVMRYQGENKIMGSKRLRLIPGRRVIFVCFASAQRAKLGSTPMGMVTIQDMP